MLATVGADVRSDEPAIRATDRLGIKFDQKAHDAAAEKSQSATADASGSDSDPDLVRLPRYEVNDTRISLRDHEVLTNKGRLEVAKRRYLAPIYQKTIGPLEAIAALLNDPLRGWRPNDPEAMALYEQDEQLRRDAEMKDLTDLEDVRDGPRVNLETPTSSKK
jgi:hypothetical protein